MNNITKSILSFIVIGLLSFFVLTNISLALDVPTAPTAPDKPHPTSPPTAPDKPHSTSPPGVPTVPPVPTTPSGEQPIATTVPGQPTATPQPAIGGPNPTQTPEEGKENGDGVGGGGEVLGLSAASGDNTEEIALMITGLIIASYGFKGVVSKKLKI